MIGSMFASPRLMLQGYEHDRELYAVRKYTTGHHFTAVTNKRRDDVFQVMIFG